MYTHTDTHTDPSVKSRHGVAALYWLLTITAVSAAAGLNHCVSAPVQGRSHRSRCDGDKWFRDLSSDLSSHAFNGISLAAKLANLH